MECVPPSSRDDLVTTAENRLICHYAVHHLKFNVANGFFAKWTFVVRSDVASEALKREAEKSRSGCKPSRDAHWKP